MPTPRGRGPEWAQAEGWFASVPAYRLASFRVVLAVATLIFHVPKFNGFIRDYVSSEFHVGPALGGLPTLSPVAGLALPLLHWVTATGLLLGVWPRACAWFLAVTGAWVLLLDPEHYSHGAQFHLTLLALAGCSTDGVSLSRLLREDEGAARCPGWPERLVRFQVAIVFFYAALDKVFSPAWGLKGTGLPALRMADHGPGLGLVQRANRALLRVIPGALSVGTILTEFLLAAVAVVPRLWRVGLFTGLTFGRVDRVSLAARTLRLGSPCRGARLPARRRLQLEDGVCAGMRRMSAKPGDSVPPRLAQAPAMGDLRRACTHECRYWVRRHEHVVAPPAGESARSGILRACRPSRAPGHRAAAADNRSTSGAIWRRIPHKARLRPVGGSAVPPARRVSCVVVA